MSLLEEVPVRRNALQSANGPASSRRRVDGRFITDEPLAPYDRHVRRELASWSAEVLQRLDTAPEDPMERAASLARAHQDAALLASSLGRPNEARLICHAGLDCVAEQAETSGDTSVLLLGFGPLVELSRLDARLGRTDEALGVLERLSGLLRGQGLVFGALTIAPATWSRIGPGEGGAEGALASMVAIETLRTLLGSGRHEAALEIARSQAPAPADPVLEAMRREAYLVSLCRLGRGEQALLVAALWAAEAHPIRRPIFEIRHAEALAAFGDPVRAHAITEECVRRVESRLAAGPATLFDLTIAARVSRLLATLGDPLAAELCRTTLPAATSLGDVPLAAELALRILAMDRRPEERAEALEALRAIATGSGYRIPAVERAIEAEDGPLLARSLKERAPSYPRLFERLLGFPPDTLDRSSK
ncbi:hypothetical protein [Polyangium fumosum]|uniref:Uncharacterized protein n=1 Tax=Polyangium fumosum TaxID=889272 RepID=A0A4U1J8H3_9BACT|nr:hypothetical protein [Polyangium fumosum]TKD03935.1 hypothetical protein E8A74_24075 [Polyangium fumosum]